MFLWFLSHGIFDAEIGTAPIPKRAINAVALPESRPTGREADGRACFSLRYGNDCVMEQVPQTHGMASDPLNPEMSASVLLEMVQPTDSFLQKGPVTGVSHPFATPSADVPWTPPRRGEAHSESPLND